MLAVNTQPTLELDAGVPDRAAAILDRLPSLVVKRSQPESRLVLNGSSWPVVVVAGRRPDEATITLLTAMSGDDRLGMVVADRLSERVRRTLEQAGHAYADDTGAVHIDRPGLLLHVEPGRMQARPQTPAPPGMGVVGVRVVQVLLGDPDREWAVAAVAETAASSLGEAHRVLTVLESDGLVTVTGHGPARRRRVADPGALLDWLAIVPSARRLRDRVQSFLYAPNPDALLTRLAMRAGAANLSYAVTGTAAATVLGARVATAVPRVMVRVDPDKDLWQAAGMLRAEVVNSGANLLLVRDLGRLGVHGSVDIGPIAVAPPVRVWLDMLGEPRGEDAAALFREAVLGW